MKKLLLLLTTMLILSACSQIEEAPSPPICKQTSTNPHRVELSAALRGADKLFKAIDGVSSTRSGRHISTVHYSVVASTRATEDNNIDTIAYIVNYDNDGGFAILGADDRISPVLAISDEGRFDINDTIDNKPLAQWVRSALSVSFMRLDEPQIDEFNGPVDSIVPPNFGDRVLDTVINAGPWLNPYVRRWSQSANFNADCGGNGFIHNK